jgi:hypothetical protein
MAAEGLIDKREQLGIKPSTSGVRTILSEEKGSTGTMQLVPLMNIVPQESDGVSVLLSREKDVGPTIKGVSLVIRKTVANITRREAKR